MTTIAETRHKSAVAALGCILCLRMGYEDTPAELHHLRTGGWGKGGFKTLMGLSPEHHRGRTGIHGLGAKAFERHYGVTQQELLDDVLERIAA